MDAAGAAAGVEPDEAGAEELSDLAAAADLLLLADFVEDFSFVAAGAAALDSPDSPDVFAVLVDFDFLVLEVLLPESASADAFESSAPAFADFDFFELVDFEAALESAGAFESDADALVDFDFFVLADFVSEAESDFTVESPDASLVDLDFFAPVDLVEPAAALESLSDDAEAAFFDFDVEVFPELELSLLSVEVASVDFFFLVVFLAGVVVESLESDDCAFTGAALASPNPRPAEINTANRYFLNRFMANPPQLLRELLCVVPGHLAAQPCREAFCLLQDPLRFGRFQRRKQAIQMRADRFGKVRFAVRDDQVDHFLHLILRESSLLHNHLHQFIHRRASFELLLLNCFCGRPDFCREDPNQSCWLLHLPGLFVLTSALLGSPRARTLAY